MDLTDEERRCVLADLCVMVGQAVLAYAENRYDASDTETLATNLAAFQRIVGQLNEELMCESAVHQLVHRSPTYGS